MAVSRASGTPKPEHAPALVDAINRKASIVAALHDGEIPIPRGALAASPQLYAAIEKAFQKLSEITGEPMDWMDYIARKDKPARRVFDLGDANNAGDAANEAAGLGGGFGFGIDYSNDYGPSDPEPTTGEFDAMDTVGGMAGIGPSAINPTGIDYLDQALSRNAPDWLGFTPGSLSTPQGAINTAGRMGIGMLGLPPLSAVFAAGSLANMLGAKPGVQGDLDQMLGYEAFGAGNPNSGGDTFWDRVLPSQYAAAPTVPQWARPEPADYGRFGNLFGGMDDRQVRSSIASRALYDDRNRGLYTDDPTIQSIYNTRLAGGLITPQGSLNGLDAVMPIEQQYLTQARGLTYNDTPSLLRALGYG